MRISRSMNLWIQSLEEGFRGFFLRGLRYKQRSKYVPAGVHRNVSNNNTSSMRRKRRQEAL